MRDDDGWDRAPIEQRLRLVDLADEFHLTTGEALEVCARAGLPVAHGGQELSPEAAQQFRETAATPVPSILESGAAARWAVPPPGSGDVAPPVLDDAARPFVPLPIGDAAAPPPWVGAPGAPRGASPSAFAEPHRGYPGPGYPPPGPPGPPVGPLKTEPLAIVAFVLAFLPLLVAGFGFIAGLLFVVPAAACASAAKKKIARQPYALTGRGLAKAAEITVVVCWILGLAFGFALRSGTVKAPTAVVSDAVTGESTQNYANVTVGTCFNTEVPGSAAGSKTVEVGRSIKTVDCAAPHDAEVFVKSEINVPGGAYPGDEGMRAQVIKTCAPQFEPYTGSPMTRSSLDFGAFFPLSSTWSAGDRALVCFVYVKDKSPVTGTLRGSGR